MAITAGIVAAVAIGTTAYAASQGGPTLPKIPPPVAPPPVPPPPAAAPPPPTETEAGAEVGEERRKRQQRFGVRQTLLTSPLGGGTDTPTVSMGSRSLLGG